MTIHERLSHIIKELGLNNNSFSSILGVNSSITHNILKGRNKPSFDILNKILLSFDNINAEWLITGKGDSWSKKRLYSNGGSDTKSLMGEENIAYNAISEIKFVNQQTFTEYITKCGKLAYINSLPNVQWPNEILNINAERCFEINESVDQNILPNHCFILCSSIKKLDELNNGMLHLLIANNKLTLEFPFKRADSKRVTLFKNEALDEKIFKKDLIEIWKVEAVISTIEQGDSHNMAVLNSNIKELHNRLLKLEEKP